jgi:cytochrome b561
VESTNGAAKYGALSKFLHWVTALGIFVLIGLGWYMVDLTYFDRWYTQSLTVHKGLGMLVLALGLFSMLWRLLSPSPAALASLKPWERVASHAMHQVLALLVLIIPVSGYLISTSVGKAVDIFGWFEVPAIVPVGDVTRDIAIACHYYCAYGIGVLVAGHAAAACKHQFIDRDGTLARMLWR